MYYFCSVLLCSFYLSGEPQVLHVLTYSFPTRPFSDLSTCAPDCAPCVYQTRIADQSFSGETSITGVARWIFLLFSQFAWSIRISRSFKILATTPTWPCG